MISRTLIHVTGPAGAGKTAFIEALLDKLDDLTICVRASGDQTLRDPRESAPRSHPELRRYRQAGAVGVALYRFPPGGNDVDSFYTSDFMQEFSNAAVIEGDRPHDCINLTVYVAPPLPPGEKLLSKTGRGPTPAEKVALNMFGQHLAVSLRLPARKSPPHWVVDQSYCGIERAQLVVVNVREGGQRVDAERLLQEVARLRKDPAVFADVLGFLGHKTPITAVAANLADPADPGLKKAIARVKRAFKVTW